MRRGLVSALLAAGLVGTACGDSGSTEPGVAPAVSTAPRVTNLMPAFWAFHDAAGKVPRVDHARLLREIALAPHREFYEEVIRVPSDARLQEILETLEPAIADLRRIDAEFKTQLPAAFEAFLAAYPDLDRELPIYVGPSLFTSSGQVRDLRGRTLVFYGLDVMAVVLAEVRNHRPDIHHELFHAYHWQRNPAIAAAGRQAFESARTSPMYNDLWTEGLALHAARKLNQDAPLALVLSSKALAVEGPVVLARVAGELRQRLDVTDLAEVGDYFFFQTKRADLPPRIAYYVGLRLAEEVGRTHSMEDMVRLQGAELRQVVEKGLRKLEAE